VCDDAWHWSRWGWGPVAHHSPLHATLHAPMCGSLDRCLDRHAALLPAALDNPSCLLNRPRQAFFKGRSAPLIRAISRVDVLGLRQLCLCIVKVFFGMELQLLSGAYWKWWPLDMLPSQVIHAFRCCSQCLLMLKGGLFRILSCHPRVVHF